MLAPGLAPEPELLYPHPAAAIASEVTRAAISSLNENRIHLFIREPVTDWQATGEPVTDWQATGIGRGST